MSESTRRRKYRYDRVVIESARILDSQFADGVLFFTGAQIELMRNMTEYLRRLETYCSEYHLGYYLTPTTEDYDSLLAIVAELEETLMGNPNTIWGYNDRVALSAGYATGSAGDETVEIFTVPAGYIYVINVAMSKNDDKTVDQVHRVYNGDLNFVVAYYDAQTADTWAINDKLQLPLKEGDRYDIEMIACDEGDVVRGRVLGYRMAVP